MLLRVSFFDHAWDRLPKSRTLPWSAVARTLTRFRSLAGDEQAKRAAPCWSPAVYAPGDTRRKANVVEVCAMVLDYDDGTPIAQILEAWAGHRLVLHTSWRHSEQLAKFRLVLPLARPVPGEQWTGLFAWFRSTYAPTCDQKCKDPSRIFFLPAIGAGGPHEAFVQDGQVLDLLDKAGELHRLAEAELAERRRQREREAAKTRYSRRPPRGDGAEIRAKRRLAVDPDARREIGIRLGGRLQHRADGDIIKGVACPSCGRASVWWPCLPLQIRSALCEHRNSCGWMGSIFDLALQSQAA